MANEEVPIQPVYVEPSPNKGLGIAVIVAFLVIAALAVGEFITIHKMNVMRNELRAQQSQLRDDMTGQLRDQVSNRLTALERQNAQDLDAVKSELDDAAKRV